MAAGGRIARVVTAPRDVAATAMVVVPIAGVRHLDGPSATTRAPALIGSGVSTANAFDPTSLPPPPPSGGSAQAVANEAAMTVATQFLADGARLQLWHDCQGYRVRYLRLAADGSVRADVMLRRTVR